MSTYDGNCNCGAINFEVNYDDIQAVVNCHCKLCRKMNGSAVSTYAAVLDTGFKLLKGANNLKGHQVSDYATKNFCATCGTPIYNTNPQYNVIKIIYL
ncbi:MAG: GFA family protein [Neisseriaceae bacterium]|jgi:hypothetical protein